MPEVHLTAGSVYTQTGRPEEAIAEIRRALELQPNSDDAYVRLGRAYLEKGETNLAIQALKNAVRLNPYYWYNQEQLARAYFRIGKSDEALAAFRKTAELDPESASAHLGIAGVLVRQGKWEESIPEYKQSIALKPTATAYTSLGTVFFYLRRYREALPYFEKAAKLQNTVPLALANLGSAYRQTGQRDKANEIFGKAIAAAYARLRLNPSDALMLGEEALLHAYTGQTAQALSFIEKARAIDPSSNELMYDEAVVHALAGPSHLAEAIKALKSALDNGYSLDEARHDPDLQALQNQPEFQALLGRRSIK
jgi:tetratricopeptide (TPR) repeat protein